jgi:3-isopropylmalate dehydrogenase/3-benzylmalate dehydrogenase
MTQPYFVAVLPGDGIGPEVIAQGVKVLTKIGRLWDCRFIVEHGLVGDTAFEKTGSYLPQETLQLCDRADAIYMGAVTRGGLLELRKHYDFFANLRPVFFYDALLENSSLKADRVKGLDILFVRELAGGIYFGESGCGEDTYGRYGFHVMKYHEWEVRRIAKVAFECAMSRRKKVTSASKDNALPKIPWKETVNAVARDYPQVAVDHHNVDYLVMQLASHPLKFDVILADNLLCDILSEIGGALAGSLGLLASKCMNEKGFALYEPVHGTAPDIAGKGIANPIGAIESVRLMLEHWGLVEASQAIARAIRTVLDQGYRTADIQGGPGTILVSTQEMGDLLCNNLRRRS